MPSTSAVFNERPAIPVSDPEALRMMLTMLERKAGSVSCPEEPPAPAGAAGATSMSVEVYEWLDDGTGQ